jgi:hypothetical protein
MKTILRRIALQPIQRPRAVNNARQAPVVGAASLSPNPRTLHLLWHEYEFGLNGRKPAKELQPKSGDETNTAITAERLFVRR